MCLPRGLYQVCTCPGFVKAPEPRSLFFVKDVRVTNDIAKQQLIWFLSLKMFFLYEKFIISVIVFSLIICNYSTEKKTFSVSESGFVKSFKKRRKLFRIIFMWKEFFIVLCEFCKKKLLKKIHFFSIALLKFAQCGVVKDFINREL